MSQQLQRPPALISPGQDGCARTYVGTYHLPRCPVAAAYTSHAARAGSPTVKLSRCLPTGCSQPADR
eukprot:7427279-Pyramimonas_sp.AAC.1